MTTSGETHHARQPVRAEPGSSAPEIVEECDLCQGRTFIPFATQVGKTTGFTFTFVRCASCGLKFVGRRLTREQNLALYDESYFNGTGFDAAVNYVMLEEQRELRRGENDGILGKIQVIKGDSRALRILDAGCGTGSLLRALRDEGYTELSGVELSEFAAGFARKTTGANVVAGDLPSAKLTAGSFDVINATEVIEHLREPAVFFRRVAELLAPGGIFLYSTGNASGPYALLLGPRWPYFHPEGHLVYYSPETLTRYFRQAGLEVFTPTSDQRARLFRCDDSITHSQLAYMGASEPGVKGRIFRVAAGVTERVGLRAATLFQGKCFLPIAVKR
jgi:2-polyprenyl-3-methyl-5-hydroxy-6-metoxy-1,4-benzoquinol methylase